MQGLGRQLTWEPSRSSLMCMGGRLNFGTLSHIVGDQGRGLIRTLRRASS